MQIYFGGFTHHKASFRLLCRCCSTFCFCLFYNRKTVPQGALVRQFSLRTRTMSTDSSNGFLPLQHLLLNLWPTATSSLMVDSSPLDLTCYTMNRVSGVRWPGTLMSIRLWTFRPLITLAPYNIKDRSSGTKWNDGVDFWCELSESWYRSPWPIAYGQRL